jgi:hypothetical protein
MPVLADALEESGCPDQDILGHCRSGGEHVRDGLGPRRERRPEFGAGVAGDGCLRRCGANPAGASSGRAGKCIVADTGGRAGGPPPLPRSGARLCPDQAVPARGRGPAAAPVVLDRLGHGEGGV